MNIIILDDYQDAVRKLPCAAKLEHLNAKVFTNTVKGIGQLAVRLRDAEILVLIRERTHLPRALLERLPKLRMIAQTGRIGSHIDLQACTDLGLEPHGPDTDPWNRTRPGKYFQATWAPVLAMMGEYPHAPLLAGVNKVKQGTADTPKEDKESAG